MVKIIECERCKEQKQHYSLNMCELCYKKYKCETAPIILCPSCKKEKKLHLKGICKTCYEKEGRRNRNNLGTCGICRKRKVINNDGLCDKCDDGNINIIECERCMEQKPLFALNMCERCYKKTWEENRAPRKCGKCKEIKIIHSIISGIDLCLNCYLLNREEICSQCGKLKRVNTRKNGEVFCNICSAEFRLKKCEECKEMKQIADKNRGVCYDCYYKEYNSRPEVIARKYEHLCNRKKLCDLGDFSAQDWLESMCEYSWKCFYCSTSLIKGNRTIDHVIPISKGGKHTKSNIVPCCVSCNSRKNNRSPLIWINEIELEEGRAQYIISLVKKAEEQTDDG